MQNTRQRCTCRCPRKTSQHTADTQGCKHPANSRMQGQAHTAGNIASSNHLHQHSNAARQAGAPATQVNQNPPRVGSQKQAGAQGGAGTQPPLLSQPNPPNTYVPELGQIAHCTYRRRHYSHPKHAGVHKGTSAIESSGAKCKGRVQGGDRDGSSSKGSTPSRDTTYTTGEREPTTSQRGTASSPLKKQAENEAAASPRSFQRWGAANRPNCARVAPTPAGWCYPSTMPREPSPPKRFARCETRDVERATAVSLLSLSGSLLLLDGPPGPRFAAGARSSCAQLVCGAPPSSSRSRRSRRRRASRRSLRANSIASVRLCSTSRAACRRRA